MQELLKKYDVPAPRYTSYPTVPYWWKNPTTEDWIESLREAFSKESATWSMYIHIPFCESLCTYCGCNTAITRNHGVETPYIQNLLSEFGNYQFHIPEMKDRPLHELHLGGGTPTFLSPDNLKFLLEEIFKKISVDRNHFLASIEVDPRVTKSEHLQVLRELGFRRLSMGVQDYNSEVQYLIHREQSFQETENLSFLARELGFDSINHDLVYGLPKQNLETIKDTVLKTLEIFPDRIALYSYAHVPWIKASQRRFTEADLPSGENKRALYELAREMLLQAGYEEIGMDHFALPTESLALANKNGKIHRNFMGYTQARSDILLGIGVSAISETPTCFHQNEKILKTYSAKLEQNMHYIPTFRGHLLSERDRNVREKILSLMTKLEVSLDSTDLAEDVHEAIATLKADGIVEVESNKLIVREQGKPFLRNICMIFDEHLREKNPERKIFSQSI